MAHEILQRALAAFRASVRRLGRQRSQVSVLSKAESPGCGTSATSAGSAQAADENIPTAFYNSEDAH